jgi:hypothetical protein
MMFKQIVVAVRHPLITLNEYQDSYSKIANAQAPNLPVPNLSAHLPPELPKSRPWWRGDTARVDEILLQSSYMKAKNRKTKSQLLRAG